MICNITKENIIKENITVPDPISDFIKAGRWNPQTEEAQADLIKAFKQEHGMR